jgi:hypothetical protein
MKPEPTRSTMQPEEPAPLDFLLFALDHYGLAVLGQAGNRVQVAGGYEVEIEGPGLYKLRANGQVVAPFADMDELCTFIKNGW